jgi:isopropylmalate/homocitrate/citramalate synthase
LLELGCDEVCLADTIGMATPDSVRDTLRAAQPSIPIDRLALHFHDTAGTALANVDEALDFGIRTFDSAAGGLGGCPFAPGAPGNLATERLIERVKALGLRTGTEPDAVVAALDVVRPYVPRLGLHTP